jgi:hypothetical protein
MAGNTSTGDRSRVLFKLEPGKGVHYWGRPLEEAGNFWDLIRQVADRELSISRDPEDRR